MTPKLDLQLRTYKIVKMSVISSEIDCVARICVVIEYIGMGIVLSMSGYAVACAVEVVLWDHWVRGLYDCHPRMWLPPRVSALLIRGGMKTSRRQPHSTTTQSLDKQVKLAIDPHASLPPRHFSLKPASCCTM